MKKDDERIKEIIGIIFFSVFFPNPIIDKIIPAPVRKKVILSPAELPIFAILVGVIKTIKKQIIPMNNEI